MYEFLQEIRTLTNDYMDYYLQYQRRRAHRRRHRQLLSNIKGLQPHGDLDLHGVLFLQFYNGLINKYVVITDSLSHGILYPLNYSDFGCKYIELSVDYIIISIFYSDRSFN